MDREKSVHIDQLGAEDLGDAISMRTDRGKLEYRYGKGKSAGPEESVDQLKAQQEKGATEQMNTVCPKGYATGSKRTKEKVKFRAGK